MVWSFSVLALEPGQEIDFSFLKCLPGSWLYFAQEMKEAFSFYQPAGCDQWGKYPPGPR